MFAIGNDELERNGPLGNSVQCAKCGAEHQVQFGERVHADGTRTPDGMLAFYKCGEQCYLAGINGFAV